MTLESPLDCKEIKPVHPKGDQPWIFIGRTDAKAPILQSPDRKSQLIGKDPDVGKDKEQEEKGMTEDEMVGWHHQLNGHGFEQAPGDGEGQGGLVCCSSLGSQRVSDMIKWLNNNKTFLQTAREARELDSWASVVAQRLSIHRAMQGTWVRSLVWEDLIPWSISACVPWLLRPADPEAVLHDQRSHRKKPLHHSWRADCAHSPRESLHAAAKTQHS